MGDVLRIIQSGEMSWTFFHLKRGLLIDGVGWIANEGCRFSLRSPSLELDCRTETIPDAVMWIQLLDQGVPAMGSIPEYKNSVGDAPKTMFSFEGETDSPSSVPLDKKQLSQEGRELLSETLGMGLAKPRTIMLPGQAKGKPAARNARPLNAPNTSLHHSRFGNSRGAV
jgi:hypothetical protein